MLKIASTTFNTHMDTSDRGLSYNFIDLGAVVNVLTGLETRWWMVSSFSVATEYARTLSVPTDKKFSGLSSGESGGCTSKQLTNMFFSFFLWETHSWYLSKYFRYILYILLSVPGTTCHTDKKQQDNLLRYLSQYLGLWIAKFRHQIYNLLISRKHPIFSAHNFCLLAIFHNNFIVPYIGQSS